MDHAKDAHQKALRSVQASEDSAREALLALQDKVEQDFRRAERDHKNALQEVTRRLEGVKEDLRLRELQRADLEQAKVSVLICLTWGCGIHWGRLRHWRAFVVMCLVGISLNMQSDAMHSCCMASFVFSA